jgi:hypothetical protein
MMNIHERQVYLSSKIEFTPIGVTNPTDAEVIVEMRKEIARLHISQHRSEQSGAKRMTFAEILNVFKSTYASVATEINDYRPVCHELFTDGKEGITIWMNNGDVIEYYPNAERKEK